MKSTKRLTKAIIDRAGYTGTDNQRCVIMDSEISGFGVRIYPTGRKAFILRYRNRENRERFLTLGDFGILTLDAARKKARSSLAGVIDGKDPLAERKRISEAGNVGDLCKDFLEKYSKVRKKTWKEDERRIETHIKKTWKNLKAESITHADVAKLHAKIGADHPYEANRVVELVSKMFNCAREWGHVPEDAKNPAAGIEAFKEKKRERWLSADEMPRLLTAIKGEKSVYIRSALLLYLLTGCRRGELLNAKWEDIDDDRAELHIPETKQGRPHTVPLSPKAIQIFKSIPQAKDNPFIFPGHKKGTHLVNISKPWRELRKKAKLEDVRLHDLRRTVGSWLAMDGISLIIIGKTLGHSDAASTQIYARLNEDPVRAALDRHGAKIEAAMKQKGKAKVLTMSDRRAASIPA